jgi:hypothetical protein
VTLGQVEAGDVVEVTEADRQIGCDTAVGFSEAGFSVAIGVATGGAASALSNGGKAAQAASYGVRAMDAAQNALDVVQGTAGAIEDIQETGGISLENGLKLAGGALGTVGDLAGLRKGAAKGAGELAEAVGDANVGHALGDVADANPNLAKVAGTEIVDQGTGLTHADLAPNSTQVTRTNCFRAGTPVAAEDGSKPIESIRAGERVWAFDLSDGKWKLRSVIETYQHVYVGDFIGVTVAGETIESTRKHPYWVTEGNNLPDRPRAEHLPDDPRNPVLPGRWVDAGDLQVGDVLLLQQGLRLPIAALSLRPVHERVYNFHVDDLHCYAVGGHRVLVHNNSGEVAASASLTADTGVRADVPGTGTVETGSLPRGPVQSQHYSSSPEGVRLHEEAQTYRSAHADGANPRRNFATADVTVDGVQKTAKFKNDPGGMHSEQRLVAWDDAMTRRGSKVEVNAVYSERPPCGASSANCRDTLGNRYGKNLDTYHGDG